MSNTITVRFFTLRRNKDFEEEVVEVVVDTGKTLIQDAYKVALMYGADPRKLIQYIIPSKINEDNGTII